MESAGIHTVLAAQQGDKAAFGLLIEQYRDLVLRLVYQRVRDADLAHDLTQETLLQAYLSLDSLRDPRYFKSWLCGIALNLCRAYFRGQRFNPLSLEALTGGLYREPAAYGPAPEEIAERLELRALILRAVTGLSPAVRDAVLLFYYEDFSLKEAAATLGISVTAMKGRLHKARQQLQHSLLPVVQSTTERYSQQRNTPMIPVHIVDVLRKEAQNEAGEAAGEKVTHLIVLLFDETGRRVLPIWIGEAEGLAIAMGLNNFSTPRPMTQEFMTRLLGAAGAELTRVTISALENDVYYATVQVKAGAGVREVDARPSDALALAVRTGTPIYVSEAVLDKTGFTIPAGQAPTGAGIRQIIDQFNALLESQKLYVAGAHDQASAAEITARHRRMSEEVIESAFA